MAELRRSLSLFDMTMIAIGSTIGSGIFITPAFVARELPSPVWILGIWIAGGITALCGALTFAELGGMMPNTGGVYVYLKEAYGKPVGFLYGWAYALVVNTGAIAALATAFTTYLRVFIPLSPTGAIAVAIGGIVLVTIINIVGVKVGGVFSDVFTILKLAGVVFLLGVGVSALSSPATDFLKGTTIPMEGISGALGAAFVGVLWSFGGWQHATFAASEAKNPQRDVPIALMIGSATVVVVYVCVNIAYMLLLDPAAMAASERVASNAVSMRLGSTGATIVALTIFVSTFGTAGIYTLTAPRIYYAMARDGVFFRGAASVHSKFQTPARAIIIQSAWAIVLILAWGTFERLISYVVFTEWIFFGLAGASVFIFRRRKPDAPRPYRTIGYPLTPAIFVAISAWFVVNTLIHSPRESWTGLGFLALGVPVYYVWRKAGGAVA